MDAPSQADITAWLLRNRGGTTQEALAADITAVTGWRITRDRYSRYESGSLPIGKQTLGHFIAYWKAKGKEGPTALPIEVPPAEPTLAAALMALAVELQASREERAQLMARVEKLEGVVARLYERESGANPGLPVPDGTAG